MNLSHVITEFSFGPYFPDITQPLDNSFELTDKREWCQGGDKTVPFVLTQSSGLLSLRGLPVFPTCGPDYVHCPALEATEYPPIQCDALHARLGA